MPQFTANEVRTESCKQGQLHRQPASDMLNAFADLLEAQEKAGVDAVRQFRVVPKGSVWTDVKDDDVWALVMAHRESYETRILFTHPAAADAERLAEALRNGLIDALRHQRKIDEDGAEVGVSRQAVDEAANILAMLAAQENPNG